MKPLAILLFVIIQLESFGQTADDKKKFENLFAESSHHHNWRNQLKDNKNELTFIFSSLFVGYKEFISSQDIDACVFTPSCSVYAIESIKQHGVLLGFFTAIDRITRCNPGRHKNLPVDPLTGKYFDPVE
jgi:putative membrane protein insertion efficiency factor